MQILFKRRNEITYILGNVKLISDLALHGKKLNARCAKIILYLFYQLSWKRFAMKEFKWKVFTNCNFADFAMKTWCIWRSSPY